MRRVAAPAALLALTLLTYAGAVRAAFVYDDRPIILQNSRVIHLQPAVSYWTRARLVGGHELRGFRPLTMISFAWNYRAAGAPSPAVFHGTSVALHALCVLAVWGLCRRAVAWWGAEHDTTTELAGFGAAALFAVHPALSQTVVYLTARSSLIAACGILVSTLCYDSCLRVSHNSSRRVWGWYAAALGWWVVALSGKESALAGAVFFAALEWVYWSGARRNGARPWPVKPLLARLGIGAAIGVAYLGWVLGVVNAQATTPAARSWSSNLVGQCAAAWEYATLLVWPTGLAVVHGAETLADGWSVRATLGVAVVAGLLGLALWARTRRPQVTVGVGAALVVIGPESYAFPLKALVNEHRLYLPVACLALALSALLVPALRRWPRAGRGALTVVLLAAALTTVQRVRVWRTAESLWADAWHKYPASCRAPAHLGLLAQEANELPDAIRYLEAATSCNPIRQEPRLLLVQSYSLSDRHGAATALGQAVVTDFPESSQAHAELGTALARAGRVPEAVAHWERALALDPRNHAARENLDRTRQGVF